MKFVKSAFITFISNIFIFGISIFTTIITSRMLGTEGSGILGVSNNIITFSLIIVGFGITASNVFFIGKDKDKINHILGANLIITIVSIVFVVIAYILNLKYNFKAFNGVSGKLLVVVFLVVPVTNLKTFLISILLGLQDIVNYNKANVIDKLLTFFMLVVSIFWFKSVYSVIMSGLVASVIMLVVVFYVIRYRYNYKFSFSIDMLKDMLRYGIKAQIGNVIQTLNYRLDIFIINYYLPVAQVGIYSRAVALGETLWKITGSVGTVILPMTTHSKDKIEMREFINKITRMSFYLILLGSVFLVIISKPLIMILLGKPFLPAADALNFLIPGISIFSISNILSNYIAGVGKVEKNIIASTVSCILTVVLDIMLIPKMGINGAAIGTSISYIVFTFITVKFYNDITGSKLRDIFILRKSDVLEIKGRIEKLVNKICKKQVG